MIELQVYFFLGHFKREFFLLANVSCLPCAPAAGGADFIPLRPSPFNNHMQEEGHAHSQVGPGVLRGQHTSL